MFRSSLMATVAISPFMLLPAHAQDVVQLDEIILSGSLSPVSAARTGSSVEVIDSTDLAGRDSTVVQRLDRLPGVNSSATGGLGANAGISLRGLPSQYVLVRLNGIDMNDPSGTQSTFDFGALTPSGIDRVEVLKGSQSALYGSEAIGGVIDITSYRPTAQGFSGRAETEAGSFGTTSGTLSLGYLDDRAELAFTYGRTVSDGISARANDPEEDSFRATTATLTARYALSDDFTVGAAFNLRRGTVEIDRSTTDNSGSNSFEERGARIFSELVTGAVLHTFAYSYYDNERLDPGGFTTRFAGKRERLSYLGSADLGSGYILNFGLDRTAESFSGGGDAGKEDTVSAQAELLVQPADNIDLSAALRYDDNSDFGGKATGRIAGVWRPRDDLALRAVLGTGFRTPSLYERFSIYGDTGLSPEQSRSFELGVEKTYGTTASVKATLFYTEVDDLIQFDGASTVCASGFGCYNQVPGLTRTRGFELSGDYALSDSARLFAAYTYTDATNDGVRLTRTPRHDLVFGADADLTDKLGASFDVRYVADILASSFAPVDNKVGDYIVVGAGITFDVTDTAQAYLRLENLFDEDYETAGGYNTPGRAAYAGIRASF